jgi:hypothetical protein
VLDHGDRFVIGKADVYAGGKTDEHGHEENGRRSVSGRRWNGTDPQPVV